MSKQEDQTPQPNPENLQKEILKAPHELMDALGGLVGKLQITLNRVEEIIVSQKQELENLTKRVEVLEKKVLK